MHLLHVSPNGVDDFWSDHHVSQSVYSRSDDLNSALEVIRHGLLIVAAERLAYRIGNFIQRGEQERFVPCLTSQSGDTRPQFLKTIR